MIALLRSADPNIIGPSESAHPPTTGDQLGEWEAKAIHSASVGMHGSVQELEFIAKRLGVRSAEAEVGTEYDYTKATLLGTPIYVAQSD